MENVYFTYKSIKRFLTTNVEYRYNLTLQHPYFLSFIVILLQEIVSIFTKS
jgi:hypothetical protein